MTYRQFRLGCMNRYVIIYFPGDAEGKLVNTQSEKYDELTVNGFLVEGNNIAVYVKEAE